MNTSTKRAAVLQAVQRLIVNDGVERLTLDAVAREAGVSKGGLLYHFPSKEALISGLIDDLTASFDRALESEFADDPTPERPGRWLRAYVRATFNDEPTPGSLSAGLLAAIAVKPDLLRPIRERFAAWQDRAVADGIDPALATVLRLATDGLWFSELCDFAPPGRSLRGDVRALLLNFAQENTR